MATRESEKQLMKELEQAVKDMDRAREETTIAKGIYDVQQAKLSRANEEVDAVASLRGGEVDWKAIIDEARKKGAPVA
jgi:hypothetical protein